MIKRLCKIPENLNDALIVKNKTTIVCSAALEGSSANIYFFKKFRY